MTPSHSHTAVVIPVYNRKSAVLEALESVARQTLPATRVVVVDDGSTDATARSITEWNRGGRLPLHLIRQANQGASAARNRGLREIGDCRYIAFLDSDDLWPADYLHRCVRRLEDRQDAVAVTTDYVKIFCEVGRSKRKRQHHLEQSPRATQRIFQSNIQIQASVCRAQPLLELGGFDESLETGEDLALFLRLSLLGPWLHAPGTPMHYRLGYQAAPQEHVSLSAQFDDNHRRWALIREDFLLRGGGRKWVAERVYRRVLNAGWRRAAAELHAAGMFEPAEACYARALYWRPEARLADWWTRRQADWRRRRAA